tara:strand:- start:1508 stop:1672 length:165 start_codon:yes stop_codon:yes gene_type:complete
MEFTRLMRYMPSPDPNKTIEELSEESREALLQHFKEKKAAQDVTNVAKRTLSKF